MDPNAALLLVRDVGLPSFVAVWMLLRLESRLDLISDQLTRLSDLMASHEKNAADLYRPALRRRGQE